MEKKAKKKLVTLQLEYLADFFGTLFNHFLEKKEEKNNI